MLVYIHIPYCDSKCHYCSFNTYVDKFGTRDDSFVVQSDTDDVDYDESSNPRERILVIPFEFYEGHSIYRSGDNLIKIVIPGAIDFKRRNLNGKR